MVWFFSILNLIDRAAVFGADLSCQSQVCLSVFLLLITIVVVGHCY